MQNKGSQFYQTKKSVGDQGVMIGRATTCKKNIQSQIDYHGYSYIYFGQTNQLHHMFKNEFKPVAQRLKYSFFVFTYVWLWETKFSYVEIECCSIYVLYSEPNTVYNSICTTVYSTE